MIEKTISHYKILEKIGGGGMGIVYKAQDLKLDRLVALKFLPQVFSNDEESKTRFIHEAKAASSLDHDNICTIYEIGESDDQQLFIAMAYYEGETLKQKIEKGKLKIDEAIDICYQVAKGLSAAHERGIVHRDVKPANIFITNNGIVKILDFGLAKASNQTQLTKMGSTVGTVAYMSPEQAKGAVVDHRTDIWSLGVVIYEMLTGKLPFASEYEQAMVYSIINEEPIKASALNENVSVELEQIVNKCLMKDTNNRFLSVDDLLVEIKKSSNELDISYDESLIKLLQRMWRKRIVRRLSSITGVMLLAIAGALTFWPKIVEPMPIAVISFENQTGDAKYDILSKVIPNLLITNLEQSGRFQVITWERLRDLLEQLRKDSVEFIDNELGFEICRQEGVPNILIGSIAKSGDIFATDLKILDVKSKEILQTAQARGNGENSILEHQIDELAREVTTEFGDLTEEKYVASYVPIIDVTTNSPEAYKFYILGKEDFDEYRFKEAIDNFTKAIQFDSTFAMVHRYLAQMHYLLGPTDNTHIHLEMAKKYRYKLTHKEQVLLDYAYAWMKGIDQTKSIAELKNAISLYPNEKQIYFDLGSYFENEKIIDSAIIFYNKVLELDPNDRWTLNNLGYTYAENGNYTKSLEYLQKYIDVAPNEHNPYDSMGDVYFRMNEYTKSIEMYEKVIKISPFSLSAHTSLAANMIKMEKYRQARNYLQRCSKELQPAFGFLRRMYLLLAITYLQENDLDNAVKEMKRISDFSEKNSLLDFIIRTPFEISEILYENGRLKDAEEELATGKKLMDSLGLSLITKDQLYKIYLWHSTRLAIKKTDFERAKKYTEKYKQLDKTDHSLLGILSYSKGNYQGTISYLKHSNSDNSVINYYLALAYIKIGSKSKVVQKLKNVVNYKDNITLTKELFRKKAKEKLSHFKSE